MTVEVGTEPEQIAPGDGQWIVEVESGVARVDHNPNRVKQSGDVLRSGDRVRLSRLGNDPVYAVADDTLGNSSTAKLRVTRAGFDVQFMNPFSQPSVESNDVSGAAAASDAFDHRTASNADPSGTVKETLDVPGRATEVAILAQNADASFTVKVKFNNTTISYSGDSSTAVDERRGVNSPNVTVEFSGSATTLDYDVMVT